MPNLPSQHVVGQDQCQRLLDLAVRLNFLHSFDNYWSLEITPYYRTSLAQLLESPCNTPLIASQARHLTTLAQR